jgi:hypothetical protein
MLHRRLFLQSAAGAAAALAQDQPPAGRFSPPMPNSVRPNVLCIFGDQFRAQARPLNGDPNSRAQTQPRRGEWRHVHQSCLGLSALLPPFVDR